MTQALCLRCGALKFGALTACDACRRPAAPQLEVNLLFSSHELHGTTLRALGQVVQALRRADADEAATVGAVLRYVALRQPGRLAMQASSADLAEWDTLLERARVPEVLFR